MNQPENAERPVAASKPHYSAKAAAWRGAARVGAVLQRSLARLKLLKLQSLTLLKLQSLTHSVREFIVLKFTREKPAITTVLPRKPSAVRPVTLRLGKSRRLSWLLLAISLMAQGALLTLALSLPYPWLLKLLAWLAASLLLAWLSWQALNQHAWRQSADAVVLLALDREGGFSLTMQDGRQLPVSLLDNSVVFASVCLLNFRLATGQGQGWLKRKMSGRNNITCLILPDAVDADEFRRLRVWLRWGWLEA